MKLLFAALCFLFLAACSQPDSSASRAAEWQAACEKIGAKSRFMGAVAVCVKPDGSVWIPAEMQH